MYPHERSLVKQLADKPFALIGINSDRDIETARKAVTKKNLNWRSFWNGEGGTSGPISVRWNISSWPTLFVIDAKGLIRFKTGNGKRLTKDELDELITKLLAEAGHEVTITHSHEKKDSDEPKGDNEDA